MNKKIIISIAAILAIGILAPLAMACPWGGCWGGAGWGQGNNAGNYNNNYNNQSAAYQKFMNETSSIREQLAAKNGEYNALMAQQNPDPKQAAALSVEIAGLHEQLRQKSSAYNLTGNGGYNNQAPYHGYCSYDHRGW
ncbi:MAG: hypothetical protein GXP53_11975 [Deltaproteobacteria bacterium]|nr:hypothetical protein [Deltaproteobacteria bacterium]